MPSVVHVVTTGNFAGVERYVCNVATETAARGWDTTVVGGAPGPMRSALGDGIRWLPGAHAADSLRSLMRVGRPTICHAHMTLAEGIALAARPAHRAPVVGTRHFAARRGSSRGGRLFASWISRGLSGELAVSDYVAQHMERPPDAVIRIGIPSSECLWQSENHVVLILQRLEPEKDTMTALRAWKASQLVEEGWCLRVVGDGSERSALEKWVASECVAGVQFTGWKARVADELASAGILLAPGPADSFGLGVVEAMAAGVPVVACAAGGHLETVGLLPNVGLFPPGDAAGAAAALRSLLPDEARTALSSAGRKLVRDEFTVACHVDQVLAEYEKALGSTHGILRQISNASGLQGVTRQASSRNVVRRGGGLPEVELTRSGTLDELVVCSLEAWDDVWRRNQFLVDGLLRRNPGLRVLFVEPPADLFYDLATRHRLSRARSREITPDGRLVSLRPLKPLPRRLGKLADDSLLRQVLGGVRRMGFTHPVLWINDVTYAPLIERTAWPSVYDVTDDWLLAPLSSRELDRQRQLDALALALADEVVVCSPSLAESRGGTRPVTLIPNGVDVEHFRRPRQRPDDLPSSPVAVYVGTLHESRLNVGLLEEVSRGLPNLQVVLVGPDALGAGSRERIARLKNIRRMGPRPYEDVPGYLQHADVVIVPHLVTPFTDSLDPIKAYECRAIGTPTVATPVAGFRDLNALIQVVEPETFVERIRALLSEDVREQPEDVHAGISWSARAAAFEATLRAVSSHRL